MDYQMQFLESLSLLQKYGLSYAIIGISFSSQKTWTIICKFQEFLSLIQKLTLSCGIYGIYFSSPRTWTIIFNFCTFFLFLKNVDYHMQFLEVTIPSLKT